jgi:hypothetical protein
METEAKKLIADLRVAVAMEPSKARAFISAIFDGKLTATPMQTEDGPRFQVEGNASVARMLALELPGGKQNPPPQFRVPRGIRKRLRQSEIDEPRRVLGNVNLGNYSSCRCR